MSKGWKITLYIILILMIIAVVLLMFGGKNPNTESSIDTENLTGENVKEIPEIIDNETPTFEEDVMKDLEGFFEGNNGYEDVEGEFGFTNPENE